MSKIKFDQRKGEECWLYCNNCKRRTSHTVLTCVDYSDTSEIVDEYEMEFGFYADILQCGGCKSMTFTKLTWDDEYCCDKKDGTLEQFPPEEENARSDVMDNINELPFLVRKIYTETLQATANKSFTLAGIGLRVIIETLCADKKIPGRNLSKRIDNLVEEGFLTSKGADILHGIRLIGNDAAHETKAPTVTQIKAGLKVVDHLISGIYIIPEQAARALPKRKKKAVKKVKVKKKKAVKKISARKAKAKVRKATKKKKAKKKKRTQSARE